MMEFLPDVEKFPKVDKLPKDNKFRKVTKSLYFINRIWFQWFPWTCLMMMLE